MLGRGHGRRGAHVELELVFVDVDRGLGEVLFVDRWAVFSAVFFGDGVL